MRPPALTAVLFALAVMLAACGDAPQSAADLAGDDNAFDFDTLDKSGDSHLDPDEVAEYADRTFENWDADADSELDADEIAGNAFDLIDADEDGAVSKNEWESGAEFWYPRHSDALVRVFEDADGDGDSELDVDELKESLDVSVLGEAWSHLPVPEPSFEKGYFKLHDSDDDGRLTEEEWRSGLSALRASAGG